MIKQFLELFKYKDLLRNLVARDLKIRYKRSVLGFLWVILNPLLMMLVLDIVFSSVFKVSTKNYTAYLLSGIILWNFLSQSTTTAVPSITGNSSLVNKIYLPTAIFPLSVVLSATVNFFFSLIPLFVICALTGSPVGINIVFLPLIFVLVVIFSFGIALFLSTMTVFFQDTIYIYEVILLAWMYLTPVFYPESIIPNKYLFIFHLNPFYYFMSIFRGAVYMEVPNMFKTLAICALCAVAAFAAGWSFHVRLKDKVIYYL